VTAKTFPPEILSGVEVAVASARSEVLLGVREGFVRYFHQALGRPVPVAVVPQEVEASADGLAATDDEIVERCHDRARELETRLSDAYQFYIGVEEGLETVMVEGARRHFVRTWAVVRGLGMLASGGSGSLEVPSRVFEAGLAEPGARRPVAGLRRRPGLVAELSGGLETRRDAVATAAFNAVAALFFDVYSGHPRSAR